MNPAASPKLRVLTLRGVPILLFTARRGSRTPLQGGTTPLTDDRPWPILALLMKAEIISIGTEILLGELLDTNPNYLASRPPGAGGAVWGLLPQPRPRDAGAQRQAGGPHTLCARHPQPAGHRPRLV